jgi:hypothetical protein
MTKSRDLANAATALNAVTATELGFVDGVTSAIQTQLDAKIGNVVSANTSTDALRITQTGSGNALIVEDEANPDSTPLAINASGQLLIGKTTANSNASINRAIQIEGTGASSVSMSIIRNSNDANSAGIALAKSRGTTIGSVTAVQNNDVLGDFGAGGADGSKIIPTVGQMSVQVDGTVSTDIVPTRIVLSTSSTAGSGLNERMRIDNIGNVGIGTSTPTAKLDVNGSIKSDNLSGRNAIYNSGFDIAQRGTSFTGLAAADYTLDRWVMWATTGGQSNYVSRESVGNLSVTPNQAIRYCGRFGRTSGTTNTGGRQVFQTLETADSVRFAGKTVTFSFYARAGANYSNTSNIMNYYVVSGTGTDQIYYNFTGSVTVMGLTSVNLTTSWQKFTATSTSVVPTNATELAVGFTWSPTGTAGAADYVEITGVQLEEGSVATPFSRQNPTIQGELAACKRYLPSVNLTGGLAQFMGYAYTTNSMITAIPFDVQARVAPTGLISTTVNTTNFTVRNKTNGDASITSLTFDVGGVSGVTVLAGAVALTAGDPARLVCNSGSSIYFTGCEL